MLNWAGIQRFRYLTKRGDTMFFYETEQPEKVHKTVKKDPDCKEKIGLVLSLPAMITLVKAQ